MKFIALILGLLLTGCQSNPARENQEQLIKTYAQLTVSYLEQNRTGMALERASRAVNLAPEDPKANYIYGLAQQQNKNYITASKFFERSLNLSDGKYLDAKNAYAVTLCRLGETSKARRLLKELIYDDDYATPDFARKNLKKCHV